MHQLRIPLQIVFYQEAGDWVAHCLQLDLVGVARTKHEAMDLLFEAVTIQVREMLKTNNPENLIAPADAEFFRMFAAGEDVATGDLCLTPEPPTVADVIIERTEARVFAGDWRAWRTRGGMVSA